MNSIRRQLTTRMLSAILLLIMAFGLVVQMMLRRTLVGQFDDSQLASAQALMAMVERDASGAVEIDIDERLMEKASSDPQPAYFQFWDGRGQLLVRSPSLHSSSLPLPRVQIDLPIYWDLPLPKGQSGRAVGIRFVPQLEVPDPEDEPAGQQAADEADESAESEAIPPSVEAILVYASSRSQLDRLLIALLIVIAGAGAALALSVVWVVRRTVTRSLLPLDQVAEQVGWIGPSQLAHRFDLKALPEEVFPIVQRLNSLMDRLQEAFQRERRFSADVAHELRTPISELRSLSEVGLQSWPGTNQSELSVREYLLDAHSIAVRMERLVNALLSLARCEAGSLTLQPSEIDLSALLDQIWKVQRQAAEKRNLIIRFKVPERAQLQSDRTLLTAILSNLLSNAVSYTPPGGHLDFQAKALDDGYRLRLSNTATQLEASDLPHMFEPFWQKDAARSSPSHFGLGLPLASAFACRIGASLQANLTRSGVFEVTLRLPRRMQKAAA